MNQSQHDELAQLFAQNMQLSQAAQAQYQRSQSVPEPMVEHIPQEPEKQPAEETVHYISSHYTGTAHVRPDTTSEPSRSPPPPYHESLMPEAMYDLLRQQSIDPFALLPNQVHLFQNADYEQKTRLIELWRIAPPSYPLEDHISSETWTSTTVEREEQLARERYEQRQEQSRGGYQEEHMLDTHVPQHLSQTHTPEPISPIRDVGEPAWPPAARMRVSSIANSRPQTMYGEAEPYIVSGYTADQSAKAIDPVYAAAAGLWQAPSYAQATQLQLEDQYGMYEQIRNHADWERMNEQIAREKLGHQQYSTEDYDMEL